MKNFLGHFLAEGVGFEPTRPLLTCRFSRPVHSTKLCHPSLKIVLALLGGLKTKLNYIYTFTD
jgi:hypothetical protein